MTAQAPMARQQLRKLIRTRRSALSAAQQKAAAQALKQHLLALPEFRAARDVCAYLANDGEIDPLPFMQAAHALGKRVLLPVLHPTQARHLWFVEWHPNQPLRPNRYRILEPQFKGQPRRKPWALGLVLMPLVAFDSQGNRMGMGGGYYDTSFAFKQTSPQRGPKLVGIAHQCQEVDALPIAEWDIPLAAIVTDLGVMRCQ